MTISHIGVMASTGEEANRASLDLRPLLLGMTISPDWVHEPQAAELLAVKPSTLGNMRRERRLDAGTHWVYATGSVGGPVVYCIHAIREMQRQRTIEAVQKEDAARKAQLEIRKKAVESYDEADIARLVDAKGGT